MELLELVKRRIAVGTINPQVLKRKSWTTLWSVFGLLPPLSISSLGSSCCHCLYPA